MRSSRWLEKFGRITWNIKNVHNPGWPPYLRPRSCVGTASTSGMVVELHHTELHHHISNLLTARVLGLYVDVEFP